MDAVLLALGQQIRHALEADGERGHVVQQRRGRRRQNAEHAEHDERKIEAHDEAVVAVDARHELLTEGAQRDEREQILGRDRDIRDLARDGGAARNGDARVGFGQSGGIVHAVTDHDDLAACGLFTADECGLILGEHFGVDGVDADLGGDGLGGLAAVAGHHHDLVNAKRMQRTHGGICFFAQRVMDADDRGELTRDAEVQVRKLGRERFKLILFALRHAAALILKDEVRAADENLLVVHNARNAMRHDVLHLRVILLVRQAAALGLSHDGVGDGVGIVLLEARGKAEHFTLLVAAEGDDLRDLGRGVGERAGFVEDDGVRLGNGFEEAPALDGDVIAAALAHGREHRDGHGELERAGEVDHQHSQHLCDIARNEIGQDRAAERVRHKFIGKARGLVLGRGFELFRLFDHVHDAVVPTAAESLFYAHDALALFGNGACVDIAALALGHGHGFARHGCLIDHRLAGDDFAVERNEAAGAHDDAVACLNIADGHKRFRFARLEPDVIDVERHRAGEIRDRLFVRPVLENFAEAEHEHHGARRREVAAHH